MYFPVVSQGLSVNLLAMLLHPFVVMLSDSYSLPSKQGVKAGCESTAPRETAMLPGLEAGGSGLTTVIRSSVEVGLQIRD